MIYTLTTNPAIDMNLTGREIKKNQVNRTFNTVYSPNGKGINVALVLRYFGVETTALGFFGGFSGRYIIDRLTELKLPVKPIWVEDITRINVFVNDGPDEYKFVNSGSFVPESKQRELLAQLQQLDDCTHLVISGSLPQGISEDYYRDILRICHQKDIQMILDISSLNLKDLLQERPLLIKPNDEEVQKIFGLPVRSDGDAFTVMRLLKKQGAQNVLLTLGAGGAYFSDGGMLYRCSAQKVKLLSSACAGDAALGAFLSKWLAAGGDIEAALKRSAATGANVAESEGLGDFSSVDTYIKNIIVRKVGQV